MTQWTPPPTALFERYGVTARQVFGSSPSLRSQSSSLADLPPLLSSRTAGTQSLSSFEGLSSASRTGPIDTGDKDAAESGSPLHHALSLGELRTIVLRPPKVRRSPRDDTAKSSQGSPRRGKRYRDKHSRAIRSALDGETSSDGKVGGSRPPSSGPKRKSDLHRLSAAIKAQDQDDSEETETESEDDDTDDDDDSYSEPGAEQSWGGGVDNSNSLVAPGGVRQVRKKKPANPFKVYEDREQRLQLERQWLMASDTSNRSYMASRMRDMRLDAVYSRKTRDEMPADMLYEDTVYFGQYSTELKAIIKKREDERKNKRKGLIFGAEQFKLLKKATRDSKLGGMGFAFEQIEAEQQVRKPKPVEKTPKNRADKNAQCADVVSLQRLQAVLQESGHRVERAHDLVP